MKLTNQQKKEAESVLENYRNAYACKKCGKIYGSDLNEKKENSYCVLCSKKFEEKK
jgi:hypothetical protein